MSTDDEMMLPKDESPEATADHHRDLDGTQVDTEPEVETFDVDDAPDEEKPDEDDEADDV